MVLKTQSYMCMGMHNCIYAYIWYWISDWGCFRAPGGANNANINDRYHLDGRLTSISLIKCLKGLKCVGSHRSLIVSSAGSSTGHWHLLHCPQTLCGKLKLRQSNSKSKFRLGSSAGIACVGISMYGRRSAAASVFIVIIVIGGTLIVIIFLTSIVSPNVLWFSPPQLYHFGSTIYLIPGGFKIL